MVDADLGRAVLSLDTDKRALDKGLADAKRDAENFVQEAGRSIQQVGQSLTKTGTAMTRNITVPILAAGAAIFKVGSDFEETLNQIVGLTDVTREEIDGIKGSILALGEEVGKTPQELAEAFYFVASAGFQAEEALDVLRVAATASAAGLGQTQEIAKVLGLTINAYGKENITAGRAADILTEAIAQGTAEVSDFAGVLGRVVPTAAQMGVSFDQVTAALAGMTLTGLSADEAATSLNQVLISLLKPTVEAEKAITDMGLSSAELRKQLREEGLLSVLRTLETSFGNNEEAAAKVFGNVRALRGALALLGLDAAQLDEIFADVTDSSGRLAEGFLETEGTSRNTQRAIARMQATLIVLADDVMPAVADILETVSELLKGFTGWWQTLDPQMRKNIVTFALVAAAAGPVVLVIGKLVTGIGLLVRGTGATIGAVARIGRAFAGLFQDLALGRSLTGALFGQGGLFGGIAQAFNRLPGSGLVKSAVTRAGAALAVPFRLAFAAADRMGAVIAAMLSRIGSMPMVSRAAGLLGTSIGRAVGLVAGPLIAGAIVFEIARGQAQENQAKLTAAVQELVVTGTLEGLQSAQAQLERALGAANNPFNVFDFMGTRAHLEEELAAVKAAIARLAPALGGTIDELGQHWPKIPAGLAAQYGPVETGSNQIGDAIKTIGQKASEAALAVMTAGTTIVNSILAMRESLVTGAQESADAIWDPEIAKLELVTLKHELTAERRKLAEENLTGAEKTQTQLRIAQLEEQLFVQETLVSSFGDRRAQLEQEKGNLARVNAELAGKGLNDDQRTILEQRAIEHRLNIDSMERQAAKGGKDIRDGFIGPLAKMPGHAGRIARDTKSNVKAPLTELSNQTSGIGERTARRYSSALGRWLDGAIVAAANAAGAISRLLRQESPAKEGPFSEGGGMEGWAAKAGDDYSNMLAARLRAGVSRVRDAVGEVAGTMRGRLGDIGSLSVDVPGLAMPPLVPSMVGALGGAGAPTAPGGDIHYHNEINLLDDMKVKSVRDIGSGLRMLEDQGYIGPKRSASR